MVGILAGRKVVIIAADCCFYDQDMKPVFSKILSIKEARNLADELNKAATKAEIFKFDGIKYEND